MNHIEKAYQAWRATLPKRSMVIPMGSIARTKAQRESGVRDGRVETDRRVGARPTPRKYAGTGRYKRTAAHREANRRGALKRWGHAVDVPLTPSERARNAVKSFWATLTPEQRSERQRKAAKKMWKRRKAEAR